MNRRELFGVTAGAVAAACLPVEKISTDWKLVINDDLEPVDFHSAWRITDVQPIRVTYIDGAMVVDFGIGKNATFDMATTSP
jgi:hypothetical protein